MSLLLRRMHRIALVPFLQELDDSLLGQLINPASFLRIAVCLVSAHDPLYQLKTKRTNLPPPYPYSPPPVYSPS
jgi:hypothetical protein